MLSCVNDAAYFNNSAGTGNNLWILTERCYGFLIFTRRRLNVLLKDPTDDINKLTHDNLHVLHSRE